MGLAKRRNRGFKNEHIGTGSTDARHGQGGQRASGPQFMTKLNVEWRRVRLEVENIVVKPGPEMTTWASESGSSAPKRSSMFAIAEGSEPNHRYLAPST